MLLKRLKLRRIKQFFDGVARIFPTHKHTKLHHLATLFHNTNVVSNPEKGAGRRQDLAAGGPKTRRGGHF